MTKGRRFILAVTVLSFLVTGFVVGCDSDDTPTVTPPSGGSGGTTPTRNMTAEEQGRDGLEETDNGSMVRNKGTVALNVRFNYDEARHYRLNPETSMPSDPANAGSAPTRVACGVPATGRANGQCFNNDGVTAPVPYTSNPNGNGDMGGGERQPLRVVLPGHRELEATSCVQQSSRRDRFGVVNTVLTNNCGATVHVAYKCKNSLPMERNNEFRIFYKTFEDAEFSLRRISDPTLHGEEDRGIQATELEPTYLPAGGGRDDGAPNVPIRDEFKINCDNYGGLEGWKACRDDSNGRVFNTIVGPVFTTQDINGPWNCFIRNIKA